MTIPTSDLFNIKTMLLDTMPFDSTSVGTALVIGALLILTLSKFPKMEAPVQGVPMASNSHWKPSLLARSTCAGVSCAIFSVWWKYSFVLESETPGVNLPMHSYQTTLALTFGYLVSLPILKCFVQRYCSSIDMKLLLTESMILYNVSQIALNGWMVWRFIDALMNRGHPFIGDLDVTATGTSYAVWIHYCDKYLEFFDTYFMVLRGRMDQVKILSCYFEFFLSTLHSIFSI